MRSYPWEFVFEGGPWDGGGLPEDIEVSLEGTTWRVMLPSDFNGVIGVYDVDMDRSDANARRLVYVWRQV